MLTKVRYFKTGTAPKVFALVIDYATINLNKQARKAELSHIKGIDFQYHSP